MADITWRPVPASEGLYEVSDGGQVRSLDRITDGSGRVHRGKVLKPIASPGGYRCVKVSMNGVVKRMPIHAAVMAAFVGPKPPGMCVCHYNGDPTDNRLNNLRYDTASANAFDSIRHGTCFQAAKDSCPAGHPYSTENTRWVKTSFGSEKGRQCRECDRKRQLAKRAANRDEYNAAARRRRKLKKDASAA